MVRMCTSTHYRMIKTWPSFHRFSPPFRGRILATRALLPHLQFSSVPASAIFATAFLPESVVLPSSPEVERTFFLE